MIPWALDAHTVTLGDQTMKLDRVLEILKAR